MVDLFVHEHVGGVAAPVPVFGGLVVGDTPLCQQLWMDGGWTAQPCASTWRWGLALLQCLSQQVEGVGVWVGTSKVVHFCAGDATLLSPARGSTVGGASL